MAPGKRMIMVNGAQVTGDKANGEATLLMKKEGKKGTNEERKGGVHHMFSGEHFSCHQQAFLTHFQPFGPNSAPL